MIVSLNEVESMVRKASRGLGLAIGLAEDCGRHATWLTAAGFAALPAVLAALEAIEAGRATGPGADLARRRRIVPAGGATGVLSAISAGPSALDLIVAEPADATPLRLGVVDVPLLLVGAAACAAADAGVPVTVCWGSGGAAGWACFDGKIASVRAASDADPAADRNTCVTIGRRHGEPPVLPEIRDASGFLVARRAVFERGAEVPSAVWEALGKLAARCLVPVDARLRLVGAGAGLVDRD